MNTVCFQADELKEDNTDASSEWIVLGFVQKEPRRGDLCPKCGQGRLDYDGLLNLACSQCGYAVGGCFT